MHASRVTVSTLKNVDPSGPGLLAMALREQGTPLARLVRSTWLRQISPKKRSPSFFVLQRAVRVRQ